MPRTKGFHVRVWQQADGRPEDEAPEHAEYILEDGEPKIFTTRRAAADAAAEYVEDDPGLTYAIMPEVR